MSNFSKIFIPLVCFYIVSLSVLSRCRRDLYHGDIGGVHLTTDKWTPFVPAGMVIIPNGSFIIRGDAKYENPFHEVIKSKRASINSFLMDSTLVTNQQYRLFISKLYEKAGISPEENEQNDNEKESTVVDEEEDDDNENENVITREYIESVKPDTNVWNDFAFHLGDPYTQNYFSHKAFDDYPCVGVTWDGARSFSKWRTELMNTYRKSQGLPPVPDFRLPTAAEYEYAARGNIELAKYPWGNFTRDKNGKLLANIKALKGDYSECGRNYTTPVRFFPPNGYGLYDMAGNVKEWTLSAEYQGSVTEDTWDLNSDYIDDSVPNKVVMGGSFNTPLYPCGTREYRNKNQPSADIGFRNVMDYFQGVQPNESKPNIQFEDD